MSGTTPPPPPGDYGPPTEPLQPSQPPNQPPGGSAWVTDYGPGAPQPPYDATSAGNRGLKVLVLTVVLTLLVGGGAFAFFAADPFHLFRSGPQAAEALPADAIFYAGMDLDPKASQKVDALRFLNHFPAFRDNAGLTDANADVADQVVGKAIDKLDCPGVTYADDVKPWLGDRYGIAVMPSTPKTPVPVAFAVQVSDEAAARAGIATLNHCDQATATSPSGGTVGVAFVNGFMVLAETQVEADTYATSAGEHSLADDPDYQADMGAVGDLGVMSMWMDVDAVVKEFGDQLGAAFPAGNPALDLPSTQTRMAATLRFGSDHVELASVFSGAMADFGNNPNPVVDLPDSTLFAFSASGVGPSVAKSWNSFMDRMGGNDASIQQQISDFEAQTGIALPDDLTTLFGDNLMLSLDSRGLDAGTFNSEDLSSLDAGVRFTNDPAKLDALYAKVTRLIQSTTGSNLPLSKQDFDDGIAVASNDAYAKKLAALDGDLGSSDTFTSVVSDGADQAFVAYFDFEAVRDKILQSMTKDGEPASTIDNVRPLRAIGISADSSGDYGHVTMRVSVDD